MGLTNTIALKEDYNEKELLKYAASVEAYSEHPIAKGITLSSTETYPVEDFKAIPGKGVQGKVNTKTVEIVSPAYLREHSISYDNEKIQEISLHKGKLLFMYLLMEI